MNELRRQRLVRLSERGWTAVVDRHRLHAARSCVEHWAARGLPLVVPRQTAAFEQTLSLALPAPARWNRHQLVATVARADIAGFDDFPAAHDAIELLPLGALASWSRLCDALAGAGVQARVYGSYGWQLLSGLCYLWQRSDVDLLIEVESIAGADAAVDLLQRFAPPLPRLDGELVFADGSAVAWREWVLWRERGGRVLVKRLDGVALESGLQWLELATSAAASGPAAGVRMSARA